jgi:Carboxypeptidase regulatory-like domain
VAAQRLGRSLVWITLAVVLVTCSRGPDDRAQGDVPQQSLSVGQSPDAQLSPSMGVIFGRVTTVVPPATETAERRMPGPIPGGSSAPVAAASVAIEAVGSSHTWRVVTSVDGSFAIAVPPGTYRVTLEPRPGMGMPKNLPATVAVKAGQQARLDIYLDTGLR